jgi:hypothetical protein
MDIGGLILGDKIVEALNWPLTAIYCQDFTHSFNKHNKKTITVQIKELLIKTSYKQRILIQKQIDSISHHARNNNPILPTNKMKNIIIPKKRELVTKKHIKYKFPKNQGIQLIYRPVILQF